MGSPLMSNIASQVLAKACGAARVTAGGSGDNTAITGATIDRLGYDSGVFVITYKTTLASTETLKFAVAYQESADGTNWDTAVTVQSSTTALTGVQTAAVGVVSFPLNFEGPPSTAGTATRTMGKRYIRVNFTPDLSASGTDTADVAGTLILGGAHTLPAA